MCEGCRQKAPCTGEKEPFTYTHTHTHTHIGAQACRAVAVVTVVVVAVVVVVVVVVVVAVVVVVVVRRFVLGIPGPKQQSAMVPVSEIANPDWLTGYNKCERNSKAYPKSTNEFGWDGYWWAELPNLDTHMDHIVI